MRSALLSIVLAAAFCGRAAADTLVLPAQPVERGQKMEVIYRLDQPASGNAELSYQWTDVEGRLVARATVAAELKQAAEIHFTLDTAHAVALSNMLAANVVIAGPDGSRKGEASTTFVVSPPGNPWTDYQIIMWQDETPQQYAVLRSIGISAGKVEGNRSAPEVLTEDEMQPLLASNLRWYVENIATDFYSAYHRYFPHQAVNWRFKVVQALYRDNPNDPTAFLRDPSLSDPGWQKRIDERLAATVRAYGAYRPLYYNLADEPGIADLPSYWDFDFSPESLTGMRAWLREGYGSLDALNAEWGSSFASWDAVMPPTTREAMARSDGNFAAWADFKEWMDVAFARAFKSGTDAVHAADPAAVAALEGGQVPGWGGWDYSLLAHAVDLIELYDAGEDLDIVRSLNPAVVLESTLFRGGAPRLHRVWHELLHGARGIVLWDEKYEFVGDDAKLGARGRDAMSTFREVRGPVGTLLLNVPAETDPIAILYSPASQRTQWMLDWQPKGEAWSQLTAGEEPSDTPVLNAVQDYTRDIVHLGLTPRFVTSDLIEQGELARGAYRVLVLPHAIALSAAAAAQIREFVAAGGTVIADTAPGAFDQHSRKLAEPQLGDLFVAAQSRASYLDPNPAADLAPLRRVLQSAGVTAPIALALGGGGPVGDVETRRFRDGDVAIVALQRDLGHAGDDEVPAATAETVVVTLPRPAFVYDLRRRKALGRRERVEVALDPVAPTVLAISPRALVAPTLSLSPHPRAGGMAELRIGHAGAPDAALHVLGLELVDPAGKVVPYYSGNVLAPGGVASRRVPLAVSDPTGRWTVRVTDALDGATVTVPMAVAKP
jgi:hypothetical protein